MRAKTSQAKSLQAEKPDEEPPAEKAEEPAPAKPKPKPIVKDDFRPVGTVRPMREMKPIASVKEPRKPKPKPTPALPSFAAPPSYQPPAPKAKEKSEGPVQKPDMPLTAETFKQGPLGQQMQHGRGGPAGRGGGRQKNRRAGSLLDQLKRDRQAQRDARRPNRRKKGKRGPG